MSHALVRALRTRDVDVVTALDERMIERADSDHLALATARGRVLFTFNVGDFLQLHDVLMADGRHHAGIIIAVQQRYSIGEQMRRIIHLVNARSAEDMVDRVEFLERWGPGLS